MCPWKEQAMALFKKKKSFRKAKGGVKSKNLRNGMVKKKNRRR